MLTKFGSQKAMLVQEITVSIVNITFFYFNNDKLIFFIFNYYKHYIFTRFIFGTKYKTLRYIRVQMTMTVLKKPFKINLFNISMKYNSLKMYNICIIASTNRNKLPR